MTQSLASDAACRCAQVCGTLVVAGNVLCDACKYTDVAVLVHNGRVSKLEAQVAKLHSIWCVIFAHTRAP